MNTEFYIARRYIFSKKSRNAINIISGISMVVVAFVTAAMITVMAAFSGIEELVKDLFSNFDAEITIVPKEGKYFSDSLNVVSTVKYTEGVDLVCRVIEEDAWISYTDNDIEEGKNCVATMKGVEDVYPQFSNIDSMMVHGDFVLREDSFEYAIVGLGVRSELEMRFFRDGFTVMNVNAPIRGRKLSRDKENAFNREAINVRGVFSVNAELDARYIFTSYVFAARIFELEGLMTSLEVSLKPGIDATLVKKKLTESLPESLEVKTRFDKNALVYQTNESEKWATFLILLFILIIASFNIVASLTMLIIEKKNDIFILRSIGASPSFTRRIFTIEGIMINFIGATAGAIIGVSLCLLQEKFGLVAMEGAMVDSYPVHVHPWEVVAIYLTVIAVGSLFSVTLVRLLMRRFVK
ncbi:MAG: FtsX-like permease family protein [Flavobacteriales bacterium]|nr:FtsX-like permease family protein [Flavobacteriales bacterium]